MATCKILTPMSKDLI